MFTIRREINSLILKARNKTESFIYSYFFPVFVLLTALLFWVADLEIIGVCALIIISAFVLVFYDDFLPIVPILFMLPMCFRNSIKAFETQTALLIVIFAILFVFLILHFIIYPIKKLKFDLLFYALFSVLIIHLVAGLFSKYMVYFFEGFDKILISGLAPFAIHFFLSNFIKNNPKIDMKKYFCVCFLSAINLALFQFLYAYLHIEINGRVVFESVFGWFCWANTAQLANLMTLALPVCCYMLIHSNKPYLWLIQVALLFFGVYLTHSDACLAIILVFSPICLFVSYKYSSLRNKNIIKHFSMIIISLCILILAYFCTFQCDKLLDFIKTSSKGSGRTNAYRLAVENFLSFPIFGVGFGGGNVLIDELCVQKNISKSIYGRLYHSTFFQVLGCAGIVGILCYVFLYIVRLKYINSNSTVFGRFITIAFIIFAVCGMVDNSEFNVVLIYITSMITISGVINKNGSTDRKLPLFIKKFNF